MNSLPHATKCKCAACMNAPIDDGDLLEGLSYEEGGGTYTARQLFWSDESWYVDYKKDGNPYDLCAILSDWNINANAWNWAKPHILRVYNHVASLYEPIYTGARAECIKAALAFLEDNIDTARYPAALEDITALRADMTYRNKKYRHGELHIQGGVWPYGFSHLETHHFDNLWLTIFSEERVR